MSAAKPLAIVTGGVRRLGRIIATTLAEAGYDLALSTHGQTELQPDFTDMLRNCGCDFHAFEADLSDTAQAAALIDSVSAYFGRLPTLLVNNAAIFGDDTRETMTAQTLSAHFNLNSFAPILLTNQLAQLHACGGNADNPKPCAIHILDQRIVNPHGDQLSYTLSKQALAGSVRVLASALRDQIRINAVAPGLVIETPDYSEAQMEKLNAMMPLGRLPKPHAVAQAVLYLAGAQHVTGQIVFADGGAHLNAYPRDFNFL